MKTYFNRYLNPTATRMAALLVGLAAMTTGAVAQTRPTLASLQAAVNCLSTPTELVYLPLLSRGSYQANGQKLPGDNYVAGRAVIQGTVFGPFRNYFAFGLSASPSAVNGQQPRSLDTNDLVVGAQLITVDPSPGAVNDTADTVTYVLNRVDTPVAKLIDGTGGPGAYVDLADGPVYGTYVASTRTAGSITIALMQKAVRDINAALQQGAGAHYFVLGGSVSGLGSSVGNEYLFLQNPQAPLPPTNTALAINVKRFGGACPLPRNTEYQ